MGMNARERRPWKLLAARLESNPVLGGSIGSRQLAGGVGEEEGDGEGEDGEGVSASASKKDLDELSRKLKEATLEEEVQNE